MRLATFVTFCLCCASTAQACSSIENDGDRLSCYDSRYRTIELIRCTDLLGTALCEVLTPSASDLISCVAYSAEGKPLGRAAGFGSAGVHFNDLDAANIDHLDCASV